MDRTTSQDFNPFIRKRYDQIVGVGLRWQSLIVSPTRLSWMNLPEVGPDPKYQWWTRLRDVPSSWVSSRGESERFLYYDGPTSLPSPVRVQREGNVLRFQTIRIPDEEEPIDFGGGDFGPHPSGKRPYYQRDGLFIDVRDGRPRSWRIPPPTAADAMPQFVPVSSTPDAEGDSAVQQFVDLVVEAGLTEPEARGMLDSWRTHFFSTDGSRYLLLMAESDYDDFCPLSCRPAPTSVARIGLILTEFSR